MRNESIKKNSERGTRERIRKSFESQAIFYLSKQHIDQMHEYLSFDWCDGLTPWHWVVFVYSTFDMCEAYGVKYAQRTNNKCRIFIKFKFKYGFSKNIWRKQKKASHLWIFMNQREKMKKKSRKKQSNMIFTLHDCDECHSVLQRSFSIFSIWKYVIFHLSLRVCVTCLHAECLSPSIGRLRFLPSVFKISQIDSIHEKKTNGAADC